MAFGESIPVKLTQIFDDESELASVYIEGERTTLGVNLWDIKGFSRKFDGLSTEKYVPVEEFDSFEIPPDLNFPIGTTFAAKNVGKNRSYGGFFIDRDGLPKPFMGMVTSKKEIDLSTVRHITAPRRSGELNVALFERLYASLSMDLKPKTETIKFEQKLEIEALPVLNASVEAIETFLSGTGQKFTANTNQGAVVGIIHQENLGPNCYGRRFVSRHQYIVKVNGELANVLNLEGLKNVYGYQA